MFVDQKSDSQGRQNLKKDRQYEDSQLSVNVWEGGAVTPRCIALLVLPRLDFIGCKVSLVSTIPLIIAFSLIFALWLICGCSPIFTLAHFGKSRSFFGSFVHNLLLVTDLAHF